MATQRKDQLLKEIQIALKRKVQQKMQRTMQTQQVIIPTINTEPSQPDRQKQNKKQQKIYHAKQYSCKQSVSPNRKLNQLKNIQPEIINSQRNTQEMRPDHQKTRNSLKAIQMQSQISKKCGSIISNDSIFGIRKSQSEAQTISKLKKQNEQLKKQNQYLDNQLHSFRRSIYSLQNQSKILKREENQFTYLKQQNASLIKEIQFLRMKQSKVMEDSRLKTSTLMVTYSQIEEQVKVLCVQLNLSFINKQCNQNQLINLLKGIGQGIGKLNEQKQKLTQKLNNFDIDTVLIKQANSSMKKEIEQLNNLIAQYKDEVNQQQQDLNQSKQIIQSYVIQKKKQDAVIKDMTKQLDYFRRELRYMTQSNKHKKPKREYSANKKEPITATMVENIQNSVNRNYLEQEIQTVQPLHVQLDQSQKNQEEPNKKEEEKILTIAISKQREERERFLVQNSKSKQKINSLTEENNKLKQCQKRSILQINKWQQKQKQMIDNLQKLKEELKLLNIQNSKLKEYIGQLENSQKADKKQIMQLDQKIYHYENYIKELECRCEEINRDINHFMPQIKILEEENCQLKKQNANKDQDIISKLKTINQLRNFNEDLENKHTSLSMHLQKQIFQKQLQIKQVLRLNNNNANLIEQIKNYEEINKSLEQALSEKKKQLESTVKAKMNESQQILQNQTNQLKQALRVKNSQFQTLQNDYIFKQKQLTNKIAVLQNANSKRQVLHNEFRTYQEKAEAEHRKLRDELKNCSLKNNELTSKITQYNLKIINLQNQYTSYQIQSNNLIQSNSQIQIIVKKLEQDKINLQNLLQTQNITTQELTREVFAFKSQNFKLQHQNKNNAELKMYYQQISADNTAKLQQMNSKLNASQNQKVKLKQTITAMQNNASDLMLRQSQLNQSTTIQQNECNDLRNQLDYLSNQNRLLTQQYNKIKEQAECMDKTRVQQLTLQNFDIQRLMKQNKQQKAQLRQLSSLSQSKQFKDNQSQQKIMLLMEQNRSLTTKYNLIVEQLQMKQKNKQEDHYINQLKNKQYCLLIKKILSAIMDISDLQNCQQFQQILQIGSERIMIKKRLQRDQQSQKKKSQYQNQYFYQYSEQAQNTQRRFNIGTQINSSQELIIPKMTEIDSIKQTESKLQPSQIKIFDSPRSFNFNFSPLSPKIEKRTQRLVSEYPNSLLENESFMSAKQQSFRQK